MLLQVRFIPPPDLFTPLASLGRSIAQIIDPNAAFKQQLNRLLITNPELGPRLAALQRQLDAQRVETTQRVEAAAPPPQIAPAEIQAAATAEVPTPLAVTREAAVIREREVPEVSAIPGVDPETSRRLLSPFPITIEEKVAAQLRQNTELVGLMAEQVQLNLENQIQTLETDTSTKRNIRAAQAQVFELVNALPADDPTKAVILAGIGDENSATIMLGLMQLQMEELVARIKALSDLAQTPKDMADLVTARMALMAKFNAEMETTIAAIEEAPRHIKPLFISNLRNTLAFRDEQFKVAGINIQSTIELDPRLSLFFRRLKGVNLTEIEFPGLELEGENIDPVRAVQVANASINLIESGTLDPNAASVRESILDSPSGLELFTSMSGSDQKQLVNKIIEEANRRADEAERATRKVEIIQLDRQELVRKLAGHRAALQRVREKAQKDIGLDREGLSREARSNLTAAAGLKEFTTVDVETGLTGAEIQRLIKEAEDALEAFEKPANLPR